MGAGLALLGAVAAFTAPAPARCPVQTITVVNQANVQSWVLARVEKAVAKQSLVVRRHWGSPCIVFAPGGWKVHLRYSTGGNCSTGAQGCHWPGPGTVSAWGSSDGTSGVTYTGKFAPVAYVATNGERWTDIPAGWPESFDHEVLEMLVDPTLGGHEICDSTSGYYQADNGVMLSDFAYPSDFQPGSRAPYDLLGELRDPIG